MNIAIVPARAGSKGLENKNLRLLGNRSLVHWALDSAVKSKIFDQIILTTDIPTLLEETDTPWELHPRHQSLAEDDTPMIDVLLDVLDHRKIRDHIYVWLLQPTSPFRSPIDYDVITKVIRNAESVISVTRSGDHHPTRFYLLNSMGNLKAITRPKYRFQNRQSLYPVYERNGLFYVTTAGNLRKHRSFEVAPIKAHVIDEKRSININTDRDLRHAKVDLECL